ncbi:hypothetical protein AAG570_002714 [Ranatra chinensis]|uniref:DUF4781 domain-containing protein n=1 Tax=Ranatra chinensis TaxID=642074 RepID=A0ABD0YV15_9HEMI
MKDLMDCYERQSVYAALLGNRMWDEYQENERKYLRIKIAFAFSGDLYYQCADPLFSEETCLPEVSKANCKETFNKTEVLLKAIDKARGKSWNKYPMRVSFVFVSFIKERKDVPLIRIQKNDSQDAYVDDMGRVYTSWHDFLQNNKLPATEIVYPHGGSYWDVRRMSRCMTPAGGTGRKVLRVCDGAGVGIGVAAAFTGLAALAAPVLLPAAVIGGVGSGLWAAGRSTARLVDRGRHSQPLGSRDAVGDWLTIGASVGCVASSSAVAGVRYLASAGRTILPAAAIAVDSVQVASAILSGIATAHSVYTIVSNEGPITATEILQISVSVFFFTHSISNFKSARNVILDAQNKSNVSILEKGRKPNTNYLKIDRIESGKELSIKLSEMQSVILQTAGRPIFTTMGAYVIRKALSYLLNDAMDWVKTTPSLTIESCIKKFTCLDGEDILDRFLNDFNQKRKLWLGTRYKNEMYELIDDPQILSDIDTKAQPHEVRFINCCLEIFQNLRDIITNGAFIYLKIKMLISALKIGNFKQLIGMIRVLVNVILKLETTKTLAVDRLTHLFNEVLPEVTAIIKATNQSWMGVKQLYSLFKETMSKYDYYQLSPKEETGLAQSLEANKYNSPALHNFWNVSHTINSRPDTQFSFEGVFSRNIKTEDVEDIEEVDDHVLIKLHPDSARELGTNSVMLCLEGETGISFETLACCPRPETRMLMLIPLRSWGITGHMNIQPDRKPFDKRSDWQLVYDNGYSEDPKRQEKACEVMDEWMLMSEDCPPAVDCTRHLLRVLLKDPAVNPSASAIDSADLNVLYSSSIMRIVNVASSGGKKKRMSMKQCSAVLGIPNWIVTLRNQVAHGNAGAAGIEQLRTAAIFLKQWLQESYWEVEKECSRDWVIERPRGLVVKDNVKALIRVYVHIKKTAALYYQSIGKIENPEIKSAICSMGEHRASVTYAEIMPWEPRGCSSKEEDSRIHPKAVEEMPPRAALKQVLRYLRPYLATDFWYMDTAQMLVEAIIEENSDCTNLKRSVWSCLIQAIHRWGNLPALLVALAQTAGDESGGSNSQRIASDWFAELLLALTKRLRADQLRKEFTRLPTNGQSIDNDNSKEARIMRKLILKKRLDMRRSKEVTVTMELMRRVAKADPRLKDTVKLVANTPLRLLNRDYRKLMRSILTVPNKHSVKCLPLLMDLFSPPMSSCDISNLLHLVKIYDGTTVPRSLLPGLDTFTVEDLERIDAEKQESSPSCHSPTSG